MRILFLSFYYKPDLCAGSFRSTALISSLKESLPPSSNVDVLTTFPNRYSSFNEQALEEENDGQIHVHRIAIPEHNSGMFDQSKAYFFYCKEVMRLTKDKEYDAIFATSSRLMTAFIGAYLSKRRSLPLFLDIRDIFVDTLSDVLPKKLSFFLLPFFSRIERWTMRQASHINLVSKGFEPYFHERYPNVPLSFFSNGIDAEFIGLEPKRKRDKCEPDTVNILYVGNIGEGQGLHKIIPELAARLSKQVKFIIIGDGGQRKFLQERVDEMNLENVEFIAPVSRCELLAYYQKSQILFLHLNDYAAFEKVLPSKLFEYGALGKPILAGVSGFSAYFIGKELDNAEVFEPCDVDMAVDAFNKLNLITSPRELFVKKYSRKRLMDQMALRMLDVWRKH